GFAVYAYLDAPRFTLPPSFSFYSSPVLIIPCAEREKVRAMGKLREILLNYAGVDLKWFPHGYFGNFYVLWTMAIFGLNLGIATTAVRLNFLSAIVPVLTEGSIVTLAMFYFGYMTWTTRKD